MREGERGCCVHHQDEDEAGAMLDVRDIRNDQHAPLVVLHSRRSNIWSLKSQTRRFVYKQSLARPTYVKLEWNIMEQDKTKRNAVSDNKQ
jgi:hypothetical protein